MDTDPKAAFLAAKQQKISGSLKFTETFISQFEVYKAVVEWVKQDPRVERASIRFGGDEHAVDFQYDLTGLEDSEKSSVLYTKFKPFFEEYFKDNFLKGWDYGGDAIIVK